MSPQARFPFSAVVGQDEARLALLLAAVDPGIGGVLLRGDKGSAKSTLARGLAGMLPGGAPFVELPLGATEEGVLGTLDSSAPVSDGEPQFRPGLLARAHGGVLYVDEVNMLPGHLVEVLLSVAGSGVNRVERDGVSHSHPARFVLVGSMNPEEGELRPQLLDRFGLSIEIKAPSDPRQRAEVVRRRLVHDSGGKVGGGEGDIVLRARLAASMPADLPDTVVDFACRLAVSVGAEGLRADLVLCRAAAAFAGWEGRSVATTADVERVAPVALGHRRRRRPFDPPTLGAADLERALESARQSFDTDPSRALAPGPAAPSSPTTPARAPTDAEPDPVTGQSLTGAASDPLGSSAAGWDPGPHPGAATAPDSTAWSEPTTAPAPGPHSGYTTGTGPPPSSGFATGFGAAPPPGASAGPAGTDPEAGATSPPDLTGWPAAAAAAAAGAAAGAEAVSRAAGGGTEPSWLTRTTEAASDPATGGDAPGLAGTGAHEPPGAVSDAPAEGVDPDDDAGTRRAESGDAPASGALEAADDVEAVAPTAGDTAADHDPAIDADAEGGDHDPAVDADVDDSHPTGDAGGEGDDAEHGSVEPGEGPAGGPSSPTGPAGDASSPWQTSDRSPFGTPPDDATTTAAAPALASEPGDGTPGSGEEPAEDPAGGGDGDDPPGSDAGNGPDSYYDDGDTGGRDGWPSAMSLDHGPTPAGQTLGGTISAPALAATVRAAAQRHLAPQASSQAVIDPPREATRPRTVGRTVVIAVDASGSSGTHRRVEAATGAVLGLLTDAYLRRDRVALVTFRGDAADVVLPPTASVEMARTRLAELPTGGVTPLAEGIAAGLSLARRAAADGWPPLFVLISDGRATGNPNATDRAAEAAAEVAQSTIEAVVVDAESGPAGAGAGLAQELATTMSARHLRFDELSAAQVETAVRDALG